MVRQCQGVKTPLLLIKLANKTTKKLSILSLCRRIVVIITAIILVKNVESTIKYRANCSLKDNIPNFIAIFVLLPPPTHDF